MGAKKYPSWWIVVVQKEISPSHPNILLQTWQSLISGELLWLSIGIFLSRTNTYKGYYKSKYMIHFHFMYIYKKKTLNIFHAKKYNINKLMEYCKWSTACNTMYKYFMNWLSLGNFPGQPSSPLFWMQNLLWIGWA